METNADAMAQVTRWIGEVQRVIGDVGVAIQRLRLALQALITVEGQSQITISQFSKPS